MEIPQYGIDNVDQLACSLYEGTRQMANLAESLARKHGKAEALSFYGMMGDDIQNFWKGIAKQLIDHAKEWESNDGCACVLSDKESERLAKLPRINGR